MKYGLERRFAAMVCTLAALFATSIPRDAFAQQVCSDGMTVTVDTAGHCCWPGQAWTNSRNACIGIPTCPPGFAVQNEICVRIAQPPQPVMQPIVVQPVAMPACQPGMLVTADTAGHCCWPGQVFSMSGQRCVGIPQCPAGTVAQGESCGAPACPPGQSITADTAGHCCWPGQVFSNSMQRCVGIPQCPPGLITQGETCAIAGGVGPMQSVQPQPVVQPVQPGYMTGVQGGVVVVQPGMVQPGVVPPSMSINAQRYAGQTVFTLTNGGQEPICEVNMSPSRDSQWGDNWLNPGEQIAPGGSRAFAVQGGERWDVRVWSCRHRVISATQGLRMPMMNATARVQRGGRGAGGALLGLGLGELIGGYLALDLATDDGIRYGLGVTLLVCGGLTAVLGAVALARPGNEVRMTGLVLDTPPEPTRPRFAGFDVGPMRGGGANAVATFTF